MYERPHDRSVVEKPCSRLVLVSCSGTERVVRVSVQRAGHPGPRRRLGPVRLPVRVPPHGRTQPELGALHHQQGLRGTYDAPFGFGGRENFRVGSTKKNNSSHAGNSLLASVKISTRSIPTNRHQESDRACLTFLWFSNSVCSIRNVEDENEQKGSAFGEVHNVFERLLFQRCC